MVLRGATAVAMALTVIAASSAPVLGAGDAAAGKRKTARCQPCHGVDGVSKLPIAPHLAGQPVDYLIRSLTAYKTGARTNEMMSLVAPNLSQQDIEDLAAWYSSIEVTVKVPQ